MTSSYDVGVPDPPETETRRDRVRRRTLEEIKTHALDQIDAGGVEALSLNAVGRAMGMSGPAVYRYFASRDALLAALVADGYASLTTALEGAAAEARRRSPARRLEAVAAAYRGWAVERPRRYALLFGPRPAGYADPDAAIAAIQGSMEVLLRTLGAIAAAATETAAAADGPATDAAAAAAGRASASSRTTAAPRRRDPLDGALLDWARRRGSTAAGEDPDPALLRLGVLTWSRIHGLVGLELAGALGDMGLDPARLIAAELRAVTDEAAGRG